MITIDEQYRIATDGGKYAPQYRPIGSDPEDKNSWIVIGTVSDLRDAVNLICEHETRMQTISDSDPVSLDEAFQIRSEIYEKYRELTGSE